VILIPLGQFSAQRMAEMPHRRARRTGYAVFWNIEKTE